MSNELIKKFEGFRASPYKCSAGVWTIGYGTTFYQNGDPVTADDESISEDYAEALLDNYVKKFINPIIRENVSINLNKNEREAIESIIYNIGPAAFNKSTLLRKLNDGDKYGAAEQFLEWIKAAGKISKGLIKRRTKELILFLKPSYIEDENEEAKGVVKNNIFGIIVNAIRALFNK